MSGPPFHAYTLAELRALELPEQAWAVDGLLPLGGLTLLTAREKAGKGLLLVDLCCAIGLAEPFLGRAVRQGVAIYVALEEHVRDVRDRFLARAGDSEAETIRVLPLNGFTGERLKLNDAVAMGRLLALIRDLAPVLVVLDTLRELHDLQEDKSDEMGPLLRPLREIAHGTETAILLNHHQNKGGTFRGSTAIAAAADQLWTFQRTDDPERPSERPEGRLAAVGRYAAPLSLSIRLGDGRRWGLAEPALVLGEADTRARILAFVGEQGGAHTAEAIALGIGKAVGTVQNALTAIRKERPCPLAVSGRGIKHDPLLYGPVAPQLWSGEGAAGALIDHPETHPLGAWDVRNNREIDAKPNGNHEATARTNGRSCVECGVPLGADQAGFYCPRHGGEHAARSRCFACRSPLPADGTVCRVCHPPGGSGLPAGALLHPSERHTRGGKVT